MNIGQLMETGWRWGVTSSAFLETDTRMYCEDRNYLIMEATLLYLNEMNGKKLKTNSFEGILYATGKEERLESVRGPSYVAELDTEFGNAKLKFIVDERTIPGYTPQSICN